MKTLTSILLLLLAFLPFSFAQSSIAESIASLPPCALLCLATAVNESPCSLTNQTCICSNARLQSNVEECVLKACTIKQALSTKNTTMTTCGAPVRSKVVLGRTVGIVLGVVSAVFVAIRIGYKVVVSRAELGWDDYFIVITLLVGIPNTIIIDRGAFPNGLGVDIWTLPFDTVTNFVRIFYVMEIMYFFDVALLKLSLLFFYQRIFPARTVKRVIWGTIAFTCAFGVTFIVVAIFQCRPISYYWTNWDGEHKGKCISINGLGWANAAISIALDIWMLAIPLSQLVHLKLAWKKKVGVAMMFFVGTFVTVVSILRLQSLVTFATSHNPTWDQWDVSNWSTIELNVGIMCACMPALRVLLVRLFPKILGTSTYNSYHAKYGNNRSQDPGRSGFSSNGGNGNKEGIGAASVINYTKTFEVQHGDNDEEELVQMHDMGTKGKITSRSSSEVSL